MAAQVKRDGVIRQARNSKTKPTLLAALLARSTRIDSCAARILSSSFSALPSLRRLACTMRNWSNHLSRRASSAGGRGTAASLLTVEPKAAAAWMNWAPASFILPLRAFSRTFLRIRLLASVFASQIGSTWATYSARPGGSSARTGTASSSVAAAIDTASPSVPFIPGQAEVNAPRGRLGFSRIRRRDQHQRISQWLAHRDRRDDLPDPRVPARQAGQGWRLRAHQAAQDRGRHRAGQDVSGGGEVPAGAHRVAQDAVPLRLRRRGGLHGQSRLRADRDPTRSRR